VVALAEHDQRLGLEGLVDGEELRLHRVEVPVGDGLGLEQDVRLHVDDEFEGALLVLDREARAAVRVGHGEVAVRLLDHDGEVVEGHGVPEELREPLEDDAAALGEVDLREAALELFEVGAAGAEGLEEAVRYRREGDAREEDQYRRSREGDPGPDVPLLEEPRRPGADGDARERGEERECRHAAGDLADVEELGDGHGPVDAQHEREARDARDRV